ncbi:MAG: glutamine--fructose-6-phosphate transaminase (isomerizing) [Candidatus Nealsonbacteria bacterium]|nr:glutamine--fructose-6-phosphate transaminase (isomerizing) [Candidatus Nealsonbacteria bacterium]
MCGIVGYIGNRNGIPIALAGLKRLEYRGYDSAGMAAFDFKKSGVFSIKRVGRISNLEMALGKRNFEGNPVVFHSRWATHGQPCDKNAHPHHDCNKKIWLVHNGIIENFKFLKDKLEKEGHKFYSDTDSEVISHLIEKYFQGNLEKAVARAIKLVRGTYALAVISEDDPQKLVAARFSAPLLVGVGEGEFMVASDPSAVIGNTKRVAYLDDGEIATLTPEGFSVTDLNQVQKEKTVEEIEWSLEEAQKGGFEHFMLKEIFEQPDSIKDTIRGRILLKEGMAKLGGVEGVKDKLKEIKRLHIVACGTAYLAGLVGEYMLEEYAGIPVEVDLGSEFRYRSPILDKESAALFISQSGETADTLASLKEVKENGVLSLGVVNAVGSSVARETEAGVYNHAGPEIAVASTKAFTSQVSVLALLTLLLGRQRGMSKSAGQNIAKELFQMPKLASLVLKENEKIKSIAKKYKDCRNFLYLGRKYNFPIALEGALKLKEISYIHAEGYGAGEMKHGPIALIDGNFPTIAIAPSDSVYEKMISNIMEVKARSGKVIAIATKGNKKIKEIVDDVIYIPETIEMLTPILSVIPLQLFAYHMAVLRGCDVDKPRNLAKSVTVE